jgi:hypothetical protein
MDPAELERERKRLPWGWGRFGAALERLAEVAPPGERLIVTAVGVNPDYREDHVLGPLGAGQTNLLLAVTDRSLVAIGTTLAGKPTGEVVVPWTEVGGVEIDLKKRRVDVKFGGGTVSVQAIAKKAFGALAAALAARPAPPG